MADRYRRSRNERGNAAVEFALVMMPLLILLFGVIQYSIYFWAMQGGSDIARSAARIASVGTPADCASFKSAVLSQINSLTGTGSTATVTRSYTQQNPQVVTVGDTVTITIAFHSPDLQFPLIPFINHGVVTTTAQSRVEFVPAQPEACP
ncbi:MAG: hypothetical protein JWQ32_3515 [Marmoricola sp.]|nr:hypothetical protein [Marmoricola sp.]